MTAIPQTRSGCWIPFGPDPLPASIAAASGGGGGGKRRHAGSSAGGGGAAGAMHFTSAAADGTLPSRYLRKTLLYSDLPWDVSFYDMSVSPAPFGGPIAVYARGSSVIEVYTAAGRYMTEFPIPSMLTSPNLGHGAGSSVVAGSSSAARLLSKAGIVAMGWDAEETLMVLTETCQVYFYRLSMSTAGCEMATLDHLNNRLGPAGGDGADADAADRTNAHLRGGDEGAPFLLVGCDEPPASLLEADGEPFDICFASIGPWGVLVQDQDRRLRGISVAERRAPRYFSADLSSYLDDDIGAIDVLPTDEGSNELVFVIAPSRGDRRPRAVLKKGKRAEEGPSDSNQHVTNTLLLVRCDVSAPLEEEAVGGELFPLPPPHDVTVLNLFIPDGVSNLRCDKAGEKVALYTHGGDVIVMDSGFSRVLFRYRVGISRRPSPFLWVGPDVLLLQFSMCDFDFTGGGDGAADDGVGDGGGDGDGYDDGPSDDVTLLLCVDKATHDATRRLASQLDEVALNPAIISTAAPVVPAGGRRSMSQSPPRGGGRRGGGERADGGLARHASLFGDGGGEYGEASGKALAHRLGFPQTAGSGHIFHYLRWADEGGLCKVVPEADGVRLITERASYMLEWIPQCVAEVQRPPSVASLVGGIGLAHPETGTLLGHLSAAAATAGAGAADLSAFALPCHFLSPPAQLVQHYHAYVIGQDVAGLTRAKALVASLRTDEAYADLLGTLLNAALHEWDVAVQERLLRVAAFAMSECTVWGPAAAGGGGAVSAADGGADHTGSGAISHHHEYAEKLRLLRILNALRHTDCGIPLSLRQFEVLTGSCAYDNKITAHVIIDRLVNRHSFKLALTVAAEVKVKPQPILVKWSCVKVMAAPSYASDAEIRQQLAAVMAYAPGATLTDTAMTAFRARRTTLAVNLLDDDPKPHSKVILFLRINSDAIALERACDANDSDLVFLVLLKMLMGAQRRQQQLQVQQQGQGGGGGPTNGYFVNYDYDGMLTMRGGGNSFSERADDSGGSFRGYADNSAYDGIINALALRDGAPLRSLSVLSRAVGRWEGIVAKFRRDQGRSCWAGYRLLHRLVSGDDDVWYCGRSRNGHHHGSSAAEAHGDGDGDADAGDGAHSAAACDSDDGDSDGEEVEVVSDDTEEDEAEEEVDEDAMSLEEQEAYMKKAMAKRKRRLDRRKRRAALEEKLKAKKAKGKDKKEKKPKKAPRPPPPPKETTGSVRLAVGAYDALSTEQIASVIVRLNTPPASALAASDANYLRLHNSLLMEHAAIVREHGDTMGITEDDLKGKSVLGTIGLCLERGLEQRAGELKAKFHIKEASFWHLKIRSLVKARRFAELDAFARAHDPKFTKSPIGWLPFIDALNAVGGQEDRMVAYIDKLPSTVAKVTWFASIKRYGKAADAAYKDDEVGMLQQLLSYPDMDRAVRDYIQAYIKALS